MPDRLADVRSGGNELNRTHSMAADDTAEQFRLLAEHHRQCEHIGQRLADELAQFSDGEGGKRRMALVAEWNAHQWPDLGGD